MSRSVSPNQAMQSSPQTLLDEFGVDAAQGLDHRQVERQRYGWNRLKAAQRLGAWCPYSWDNSAKRSLNANQPGPFVLYVLYPHV